MEVVGASGDDKGALVAVSDSVAEEMEYFGCDEAGDATVDGEGVGECGVSAHTRK